MPDAFLETQAQRLMHQKLSNHIDAH